MDNSRLTLVGPTDLRMADRHILYYFDCQCGGFLLAPTKVIRNGNTKSCGCLKKEVARKTVSKFRDKALAGAIKANTRHGMRKTKFYRHWQGMITRCNDKTNPHYGGRGISVCERWKEFENFKEDMYKSYVKHVKIHGHTRKGTSVDRINVNGNYEPSNCRWATAKMQRLNQRKKLNS